MTSSLLDTALDLSVIGGYTNGGYLIRSRGWKPLPRMEGKVVLITGATSGLGLAAAGGFARLGATVWLAARNRERGEAARARILEHQGEADVHVVRPQPPGVDATLRGALHRRDATARRPRQQRGRPHPGAGSLGRRDRGHARH
ncbi:MAG: SDR family NAD(P)-dependent oxidoreductase [Solirubrobacterales bacterium]|nr:SDR family NAD(P)-dependent oxidoreductase [Solirubrobacterales bacterium]